MVLILTKLTQWLSNKSPKLIVFTGAGCSADSGLSTFRSDTGLWENHDVDVVANGFTWRENYQKVTEFYNKRRNDLAQVTPNAMHYAIADWQKRYNTIVITQNIDDLLERAGCSNVIHVHGELKMLRCVACGNVWDIGYSEWSTDDRCKCGSRRGVRPAVVFFNEDAPEYIKMYRAFSNISNKRDCAVVIGTSGQVVSPDELVMLSPAYKILNNLESSRYINEKHYNNIIFGNASECYKEVDQLISKHMDTL